MPLFGPPNVEKLEEKENVKGLIKALRYKKNDDVREAAARALRDIGNARAVEPLIAVLEDFARLARTEAARALGQIGDDRAVPPLIAALNNEYKDVRKVASEALIQIGAPAKQPLVAALKDEDKLVRGYAVRALDQLGWKPDRDEAAAWYWISKRQYGNCIVIGEPAVEPLIATLETKSPSVRRAAVEALGRIGEPAVEPLITTLETKSPSMRRAAVEALGRIGDFRAVQALIATLRDKDADVRKVTVIA